MGEAISALELDVTRDADTTDWRDLHKHIWYSQPALATRVRWELWSPASRGSLVRLLGSLAKPFTLFRNDWNSELKESWEDPVESAASETCNGEKREPLAKRQRKTHFYFKHLVERELFEMTDY